MVGCVLRVYFVAWLMLDLEIWRESRIQMWDFGGKRAELWDRRPSVKVLYRQEKSSVACCVVDEVLGWWAVQMCRVDRIQALEWHVINDYAASDVFIGLTNRNGYFRKRRTVLLRYSYESVSVGRLFHAAVIFVRCRLPHRTIEQDARLYLFFLKA